MAIMINARKYDYDIYPGGSQGQQEIWIGPNIWLFSRRMSPAPLTWGDDQIEAQENLLIHTPFTEKLHDKNCIVTVQTNAIVQGGADHVNLDWAITVTRIQLMQDTAKDSTWNLDVDLQRRTDVNLSTHITSIDINAMLIGDMDVLERKPIDKEMLCELLGEKHRGPND